MRFLFILCLFSYSLVFSQSENSALAEDYFKNGEFEKALISYQKLYKNNSSSLDYIYKLVRTHQQLQQYKEVDTFLKTLIEIKNYPPFTIELGYNYALQNDTITANTYYNNVINSVTNNPSSAFAVGQSFHNLSLLNQAIATYTKAMESNTEFNFDMQLARIYGEQGDVKKMFTKYIEFGADNTSYLNTIKRELNTFISENKDHQNNKILRLILLKKIQDSPDILWNEMLSWLFIQQKEYNKAFAQEKAIYKREMASLDRIEELANIAHNQKDNEIATSIFTYIVENTQNLDSKINAYYNILKIKTSIASPEDYETINKEYLDVLAEYGGLMSAIDLKIAYGHFLAFYLKQTDKAIHFLKEALKADASQQKIAEIKLELGDILVLEEKFNEALIYYTQIQRSLKNSTISQEARFKVAKTSYYKGDFKWAESQLKILKASTSQLTANDALDLKLLITDNKLEDSLHVALKSYAKADLLHFQNKNEEAIALLDGILITHSSEAIIPQTLLKQAQLFEIKKQYDKAIVNYQQIIANYNDGILVDDAIYGIALLYDKQLEQPEKAKPFYETILFNHQDSIFFVEARKRFRALRGDSIQ
ncbi:hypothetical protein ES676_06230 [Bizionia saleffrena]|uniref:Tetratricopeptide repeat protein n=1 Tax=Bizionia saleffrena TaxID=291189 RepID=A0A8H2QET2_9FLAO|nr:tetratricopeptide repeat protein [Bizionia saleffrena]TYB76047.1 hypothetical protein ES676_06230 [Bizionia saleffrena]